MLADLLSDTLTAPGPAMREAMAHAAVCMPNLAFESDITGHLRYPVDIINERLDYRDGAIHPPEAPGLGVSLNEEILERWRLDK